MQERGLSHLTHLVGRFFAHVAARPLSPSEQDTVTELLDPELQRLFYRQPVGDQRHAVTVLGRLGPEPASNEAQAALLHDIGKHDVDMGATSRSMATVWAWTGLPIWGRWRRYIEHGARGADMLDAAGADAFTIAFTRIHPGSPPAGVDRGAWSRVARADDGP